MRSWWGWIRSVLPSVARVQRGRMGQSRQRAPKTALFFAVMVTVWPAGQVAVPAAVSMLKWSIVNAPGASVRGRVGQGLIVVVCPAPSRSVRVCPEP